ncbi:MAG: hypothetical protein ACLP7P_06615 [Rhodomicrobium sp.]
MAGGPLRLGNAPFAALFVTLALLASLPVLLTGTLPLFDYPNHLARMYILSALPLSEPLQRYYEINWSALPNLAMDLAIPALAQSMPLAWAGKVFVVLTFCLLAGGAAVLHRVLFESWSAWPCLAFLLLFSRTLLWGLLNYLSGIGACLIAFAVWIALRERTWLRLTLGTAIALGLFFVHLMAFGFYGIMVMGYEGGIVLRERPSAARALRTLFLAGATFLPALAVLLLLTPGGGGGPIAFSHIARKIDFLFSVFDNYHTAFDVICFALVLLAGAIAFWKRWVRLHPAIVAPLALVFLAYLAMPAAGASSSGADYRVPVFLGLLLVAGSRWTAPRPRLARAFMGAVLLLFVVRVGVVMAEWRQSDRVYAELLPAFDKIPLGSRLAVAVPPGAAKWTATPLLHFPVLAVLRRDAFVPTLFAHPAQQPVALREHYRTLAGQLAPQQLWAALVDGTAPFDTAGRAALAQYDFIVFVGPRPFAMPAVSGLIPIVTAPRFVLARLAPPLVSRPDPALAQYTAGEAYAGAGAMLKAD